MATLSKRDKKELNDFLIKCFMFYVDIYYVKVELQGVGSQCERVSKFSG